MSWVGWLIHCRGSGFLVWAFHPFAALRRVSQISASRLRSVPLQVIDWAGAAAADALPDDGNLQCTWRCASCRA